MKKIGFALQVFALLTILPVYVVMEMNHSARASTENIIVLKNAGNGKLIDAGFPVQTRKYRNA